ncbi:MAG: A/G-specific adenine glycosylase [Phycisphaerales bacterium]|nr:A/G-specific adenine glycosylase [Phycisphaerales bacterium]
MKITADVEQWFSKEARSFPWRSQSTPWGRLVSEFMAQQTQIERVADRWPKMLKRYPTSKKMAESNLQEILTYWQGLGYYRRAKHLKQTAEMIERDFDGKIPTDVDSLLRLPGVGRYTAGAIASIAFNQRVPIVDGNVHRVICRVEQKRNVPSPNAWSWQIATKLVHESTTPSTFNEGIMELGATVCTPKNPTCARCPLKHDCISNKEGSQHLIPPPKKPVKRTEEHHYAVILSSKGKIALEQRGMNGLWAGMWQVPTLESPTQLQEPEVLEALEIKNDVEILGSFEHKLTHRIVTFVVYHSEVNNQDRYVWHTVDELDSVPLATAQKKVIALHCAP